MKTLKQLLSCALSLGITYLICNHIAHWLIPLATVERGYRAIGGEYLALLVLAIFLFYSLKILFERIFEK